jgi:hypothetical protein
MSEARPIVLSSGLTSAPKSSFVFNWELVEATGLSGEQIAETT